MPFVARSESHYYPVEGEGKWEREPPGGSEGLAKEVIPVFPDDPKALAHLLKRVPLNVESPNAGKLANSTKEQIAQRWLEFVPYVTQPMNEKLSGLKVEYRVVSLYSRDAGKREAKIALNVGQGTQDIGYRNDVDILFDAKPAVDVTLEVKGFELRAATTRASGASTSWTTS